QMRDGVDVLRLALQDGLVSGDRLVIAPFVETGARGLQHALEHLGGDGTGRGGSLSGARAAGAGGWRRIHARERPRARRRHRWARVGSRIAGEPGANGDAEGKERDGAGREPGRMTPAATPRRVLHARRSSFPLRSRTQAVEPGENLGGLRFVTGLELGVIVVADMAGLVLELELPEH